MESCRCHGRRLCSGLGIQSPIAMLVSQDLFDANNWVIKLSKLKVHILILTYVHTGPTQARVPCI